MLGEGEIIAREFVVSSGDATKMFDAIEETFDDVSDSVQRAAVPTLGLSIRAWRDDNLGMCSTNSVCEGIRVGAFVGDHRARMQMLDQFVRARNIGNLSLDDNYSPRTSGFIRTMASEQITDDIVERDRRPSSRSGISRVNPLRDLLRSRTRCSPSTEIRHSTVFLIV